VASVAVLVGRFLLPAPYQLKPRQAHFMNENTLSPKGETKHVTLGHVLSWIFGTFLFIGGIGLLFSKPLEGILLLLAGAILLPPINSEIKKRFNITLSGGVKVLAVLALCVVAGVALSGDAPAVQSVPVVPVTTAVPAPVPSPVVTATVSHTAPTTAPVAKPVPVVHTVPPPAPTPSASPVSSETVSQRNAVKKAMAYLSYSAFSHDGLVGQLEYDQFSPSDALYGADNSGADWNKEAAKKAQEYMSYSAFSHDGLVAQLEYDKFTQAQAEYGANAVGL
jgi:hypothetical protein